MARGSQILGPHSPPGTRAVGWCCGTCSAGSGVRWGPPQHPRVLCPQLQCPWAWFLLLQLGRKPQPCLLPRLSAQLSPLDGDSPNTWRSWHGGGAAAPPCRAAANLPCKPPPPQEEEKEQKKKKKKSSIPQPELCAILLQLPGTSWLGQGLLSLPQSPFQVPAALFSFSTNTSAG